MALTGNEPHSINLQDAIRFTAAYREEHSGEFLGGFFGNEAIKGIMNQENCVGIRIYNAIDDDNNRTFVVVGVTADNADISGGEIAEFSLGCPPHCDQGSPLVTGN